MPKVKVEDCGEHYPQHIRNEQKCGQNAYRIGAKKENDNQSEQPDDIGLGKTGTMPPEKQVRPQSVKDQLHDPDDQGGVKEIVGVMPNQPTGNGHK